MALMETLKDDFEFGGLDTGKWSSWGSTTTSATTNLCLELTSTTAANYGGTLSLSTYDLTGSYAFSQLVDAGNQSITSLEVYPLELTSGANALAIMVNLGTVFARKKLAGSYTTVGSTVAYNSTTMKWFRIRESGGTTFWDYAADPAGSWTNIASLANPITVTALTAGITIGTWQAEASTSTVKVDNFNCLPGESQFSWMGYTWNKRIHAGAPANNQTWSSANVGSPDANNYLTFSLTNAGSAPIGCEIFSAQRGFGYGTYTAVVGTRLDTAHAAVGFGGMFTFDFTAAPDYREIDMQEIRPYASLPNKQILYNHAWNNGGSIAWVTNNTDQASDVLQTHVCTWTPTKVTFRTYSGAGSNMTLRNYYEQDSNLPAPGLERVHFNIYVDTSVAGYASATPIDVVVRSFTFSKFQEPGSVLRHLTVGNGMSRSEGAT